MENCNGKIQFMIWSGAFIPRALFLHMFLLLDFRFLCPKRGTWKRKMQKALDEKKNSSNQSVCETWFCHYLGSENPGKILVSVSNEPNRRQNLTEISALCIFNHKQLQLNKQCTAKNTILQVNHLYIVFQFNKLLKTIYTLKQTSIVVVIVVVVVSVFLL
jgi:hypothetical protein